MGIIKKPYEISLWGEELVWLRQGIEVWTNKNQNDYQIGKYYSEKDSVAGSKIYELDYNEYNNSKTYYIARPEYYIEGTSDDVSIDKWPKKEGWPKETVLVQYYKEYKKCILGSSNIDFPARAVNSKLNRKINGENTLTFTLYYQYIDNITGEKVYNPFVDLISNESKIKLHYNNKYWFEFIVKNIQENSETKAFTYTCKDLFVNELSKTGFEIELDNELENNMGTIEDLGSAILEGSDWTLKATEPLKQYVEEPLYKITLGKAIKAQLFDQSNSSSSITIPEGKNIYVFYSLINEKSSGWQFLYQENDEFTVNDNLVIDKDSHQNYFINVTWPDDGYPDVVAISTSNLPLIELIVTLRGQRLMRQSQTKYDSTIDKYVQVYNEGSIYGFTQSEYVSSVGVNNYVANPSCFTDTFGWQSDAAHINFELTSLPKFNPSITQIYTSFIKFVSPNNTWIKNSGIEGNRSIIKKFNKDEDYILRIKYKRKISNGINYVTTAPTAKICKYDFDANKNYSFIDNAIFDFKPWTKDKPTNAQKQVILNEKVEYVFEESKANETSNFIYMKATCNRAVSETELLDWDTNIGLFLQFGEGEFYIEDCQVFPYQTLKYDGVERLCVPGGKPLAETRTKYIYYKPDSTMQSIADLKPIYSGYIPNEDYIPYYKAGSQFTKIRSITAKESNRFNLLQSLSETFKAWLKIEVPHESDGRIALDENKRPIKQVSFHEIIGKKNYTGFRYGVNSKSISRTLDSASIISKMIVKDNANEFAPNGFCSIARASENITGENFLLNFDYYVRHKLLDFDVITNDLYLDTPGYLGYYKHLKTLNANRDALIDSQAGLLVDIAQLDASYVTYKSGYEAAVNEQLEIEQKIINYTEVDNFNKIDSAFIDKWSSDEQFNAYLNSWCRAESIKNQYGELYLKLEHSRDEKQQEYDSISNQLKSLADKKKQLWLGFYKKYSRFIQEGSWIKEDYIDPNLYYIDAESVLQASTQPQVTYSINLIDVSALNGYEDYSFDLGDQTYIEDTEFFGWSLADRNTPYREEIIVSEIGDELDSPEKTQIKVQNYRTQFEDLFQRITAQTQQAEYHTGEYNRAASVVQADGTISLETLQNSFNNNSLVLSKAYDQSVIIDSSGLTTISTTDPSNIVRLVSGGIFLSSDGGKSWKTGISGRGINTQCLTSGQINTNEIYIMNGNNAAFRWDAIGLNAYGRQSNGVYSTQNYVRFNEYGIYGVNNIEDWAPNNVQEVHEKANFALTWGGFSLKNKYGTGSVGISTSKDFYVNDGSWDRIKIGKLSQSNEKQYVVWTKDTFEKNIEYYSYDTQTGIYTIETNPTSGNTYYILDFIYNYGIQIRNNQGNLVMSTDDNGELWLDRALYVGTEGSYTIWPGALDKNTTYYVFENGQYIVTDDTTRQDDKDYYIYNSTYVQLGKIGNKRVIDANGRFIVNEDGSLIATEASISGHIEATDGKIGQLTFSNDSLIAQEGFQLKVFGSDENALAVSKIVKEQITGDGDLITIVQNLLEFNGVIKAQAGGQIGGFDILEDRLVSKENREEGMQPSIEIIGASGKIIANNIELGAGATIKEFIRLGEAYIQNPEADGIFINAGAIKVYDQGIIELGQILLDGTESKISGTNFLITPNEARFSNVYVSGEIETVNFKKNSVQAAGGTMIFRPTYKPLYPFDYCERDNNQLECVCKFEEDFLGGFGYTVLFVSESSKRYYGSVYDMATGSEDRKEYWNRKQVSFIFDNQQNLEELEQDIKNEKIISIIDLGPKTEYVFTQDFSEDVNKQYYSYDSELNEYVETSWNDGGRYEKAKSEVIIGINAGETDIVVYDSVAAYHKGITITSQRNNMPNVFLGDLSSLPNNNKDFSYQGYGLYADNTYLNGSLTTKTDSGTYAGVNTLSEVKCTKENVDSNGNIIFWAGAKSMDSIQDASFQVTDDGYVYIENSIFAGGKIIGAEIHTAKIYGSGEDNISTQAIEPALSIYDAQHGISFRTVINDEDNEVFSINSTGLGIGDDNFVLIDNNQIIFKTSGKTNYVALKQLSKELNNEIVNIPALFHYHDETKQCGLFFEDGKTMFRFINSGIEADVLEMTSQSVNVKQQVEFSSESEGVKMQYKAVKGGYDLYVVASS